MQRDLMATPRSDDWIATYYGGRFWPFEPAVGDLNIFDIAHSLSMQCRYTGHCIRFYSVAEHCVLIHNALKAAGYEKPFLRWALMHDAAEAYISDLNPPTKRHLSVYTEAEARIQELVIERWLLEPKCPAVVKEYDRRILLDEREQNMNGKGPWPGVDHLDPLGVWLQFWAPTQAKNKFLGLCAITLEDCFNNEWA